MEDLFETSLEGQSCIFQDPKIAIFHQFRFWASNGLELATLPITQICKIAFFEKKSLFETEKKVRSRALY